MRRTLETCQVGTWHTVQSCGRAMRAQGGGGSVVIVSSIMGRDVLDARSAPYAMSKAALIHLSRCLAGELAPLGIRVNCVCPGWIDTEGERQWTSDAEIAAIAPNMPLGRLGHVDDVGAAVAWLCAGGRGQGAGYVSGAVLDVDGAYRSSLRLPCCLAQMR